jgi:hypothetical protein
MLRADELSIDLVVSRDRPAIDAGNSALIWL